MSRPTIGEEPLDQRIQVMMSRAEVARLEDWMRSQGMIRGRSEAIRQLIARGLTAPDEVPAEPQKKRKRT